MNQKRSLIGLVLFLLVTNCYQGNRVMVDSSQPFLVPPFPNINVPYEEFNVAAERGDTVFCKNGSFLLFPPHAFLDKDGNRVTGEVLVRYREFYDPVDYYFAGVPMNYDSAGRRYMFESSIMCEIQAYQNGKPVFVNSQIEPELYLNDKRCLPGSLYYLDTTIGKWLHKGLATDTDTRKTGDERTGLRIAVPGNQKTLNLINERDRQMSAEKLSGGMIRGFEIDGFGLWNIDMANMPELVSVSAVFQDHRGKGLYLSNIAVINRKNGGLWQFPGNKISFVKEDDNMIIGIWENRIVFHSFRDFRQAIKDITAHNQLFKMTVLSDDQHDYDSVKTIMLQK